MHTVKLSSINECIISNQMHISLRWFKALNGYQYNGNKALIYLSEVSLRALYAQNGNPQQCLQITLPTIHNVLPDGVILRVIYLHE